MALFKNKYRIDSTRLTSWNYNGEGMYFVTICTKNREHFFGECKDKKMKLSSIGALIQGFWYQIPKHFPHVTLGEFIVMPNHIHGIIDIGVLKESKEKAVNDVKKQTKFYQSIAPKASGVPVVIRSFKSVCTKHINEIFPSLGFAWQERYWEHIIKDVDSFQKISNYIYSNPDSWEDDKFFLP
jgi:REP element-mobilizing transposase RayT